MPILVVSHPSPVLGKWVDLRLVRPSVHSHVGRLDNQHATKIPSKAIATPTSVSMASFDSPETSLRYGIDAACGTGRELTPIGRANSIVKNIHRKDNAI